MKLFCGHWLADSLYYKMSKDQIVRCPKCGLSWRGWMVIQNDKTQPKRELRFAAMRSREKR